MSDCDVLASVLGSLSILRRSSCYGLEGGVPMLGVLDGILMALSCSRPRERSPTEDEGKVCAEGRRFFVSLSKGRVSGRWREAPAPIRAPLSSI